MLQHDKTVTTSQRLKSNWQVAQSLRIILCCLSVYVVCLGVVMDDDLILAASVINENVSNTWDRATVIYLRFYSCEQWCTRFTLEFYWLLMFNNKQPHLLHVKTYSSGMKGWYCVSAQAWKTGLPVDKHIDTSLNAGNPRWNNPIKIKSIKFVASKESVIITAAVWLSLIHTYTPGIRCRARATAGQIAQSW